VTIGNFTRHNIETLASDRINTAIAALSELATMRARIDAEFAAGTLDGDDFYPAADPKAQTDKANILGAYDQAAATYAWLTGRGDVPAPTGDPMAYAKFVI
jgi:hypothetical protein